MLVKVYKSLDDVIEFSTQFQTLREILSYIKYSYGFEVSDSILYSKHYFIGKVGESSMVLTEQDLANDLCLFEELTIVPEVSGEEPISASMIISATAWATSGSVVLTASMATVIATTANIAIGIGLSMAVSAIMTPDSSFNQDPATSQSQRQSKIFNTSTIITEQGGSVPLVYGNPFCGGTLISSSLTSNEISL